MVGCADTEGVELLCTGLGIGCAAVVFWALVTAFAVYVVFVLPLALVALLFAMASATK